MIFRLLLPLLTYFIVAQAAYAGSGTGSGSGLGTPTKNIGQILSDISGFALGLGIAVASLMIIFAGYQMLTAAGNQEKFSSGTKTITYALVGVGVMLLSTVIIDILKQLIGIK